MELDRAVEMFLDHRRHRAAGTRRQYRYWLTLWLGWRLKRGAGPRVVDVGIDDIRGFMRYLENEHIAHSSNPCRPAAKEPGLEPASIAAAKRTIRAIWSYLDGEELLSPQQARFFRNNRIVTPPIEEEPRPYCDEETFRQLIAACDDGGDDVACNQAILWLLYDSGMRVGELCHMEDARMELAKRRASIRGKGARWRHVFWTPPAAVALISYVLQRPGPRGTGPVFRNSMGESLTPDAVRARIKRIAARAGVMLPPGCPVHWFRHAYPKRAYEGGLADLQVSQLMGHSSLEMTQRYAREFPDRLQAIYDSAFCQSHVDKRPEGAYTAPRQVKIH